MKKAINMRPNSSQKIVRPRSRRNNSDVINKARIINQNSPRSPEEELDEAPKMDLAQLKFNSQISNEE
jgi:hypothetical protein